MFTLTADDGEVYIGGSYSHCVRQMAGLSPRVRKVDTIPRTHGEIMGELIDEGLDISEVRRDQE